MLGLRTVLESKLLLAANVNAIPGPDGPMLDSDGDGLTDVEEENTGTSPTLADTDGDGVSDNVEVFSGLDPLLGEIPLHLDIRVAADGGAPIVVSKPDSPQADAFRKIAREMIAKGNA